MDELLVNILEIFGFDVMLQGSLGDNPYPSDFFTYWNNETYSSGFYNNSEMNTVWNFDVNFYSNDPNRVNTILIEAKKKLKEAGFIVQGKGYDVGSDEPTHTGRGMNVIYIEREV